MRLVAAGLSFHSAPLALRERAVISDAEAPNLLRYLVGHPGLTGAAVLSTCNRTEFYVTCESDDLAAEVVAKLGQYLDPGNDRLASHLNSHHDEAAVAHICRVAAGLDSMVVGEAQVLGQVRDAHRLAVTAGTLGAELDVVLRGAIEAGKRVRTETALGRGASSLSQIALDAAVGVVGDLRGRSVLVIGAGTMSRLIVRRLIELGADVRVTSRSESARRLAAEMGASAIDRDEILTAVAEVDVVITSTSSPAPVVSARDAAIWQTRRQGRPLCIVDLAVPRDVEAAAADVPGVHLVDIDELGRRVEATLDGRREAMPDAEAIVTAEVASVMGRIHERVSVGPTIAELVGHAEATRRRELDRTLARMPGLDAETVDRIDQLTQSLVRKLLHDPIHHLRDRGGDPEAVAAARDLFGLGTAAEADPVTTGVRATV